MVGPVKVLPDRFFIFFSVLACSFGRRRQRATVGCCDGGSDWYARVGYRM